MVDLARSPDQIGAIIRRNRKRMGLSQSELGERAGLRQETISLIETGNPATRIDTVLAILAALDLEFQVTARGRTGGVEDLIG
ncbi:helix-turn-helix domain-containing protein [Bosea sp. (in: a-proteobacteria)]|uniref:helix-turn-helix domain-containing protein n=1 Tax=Bosea sp. (in: a-proteobacteria) TaxID=1871050 RepID=UPI003B3AC564